MRRLDLPRIGRYRLYDLLPAAHLRCRLCGARLRRDNAWRHYSFCVLKIELTYAESITRAKEAIRLVLLRRRLARHRRHSQFEHETGGRYD